MSDRKTCQPGQSGAETRLTAGSSDRGLARDLTYGYARRIVSRMGGDATQAASGAAKSLVRAMALTCETLGLADHFEKTLLSLAPIGAREKHKRAFVHPASSKKSSLCRSRERVLSRLCHAQSSRNPAGSDFFLLVANSRKCGPLVRLWL